jgi:hypothetical protein
MCAESMNMKTQIAIAFFSLATLASAQSIRATITGGDSNADGKCTFEVEVDGAAEIEIRGDRGSIRQISGQTATWRRLTCNQPLPNNPGNFRFKGIDGRGEQTLVRDPNASGGVAVIRVTDPKGGSHGYTGDIEWRGGNYDFGGTGNWDTGRVPNGSWNNSISNADALRICKEQVVQTRNVRANRVQVSRGASQQNGDSLVNFTFRNANNVTKRGSCTISSTGQILQFELDGNNRNNRNNNGNVNNNGNNNNATGIFGNNSNSRASWNQALNSCQEEAARRLGVPSTDIRVQHGLDPGNGDYLVNYQAQDRSRRIRTGSCRVSATGEIEEFRQ